MRRKMKRSVRKSVALMLVLTLLTGMLPAGVFKVNAAENYYGSYDNSVVETDTSGVEWRYANFGEGQGNQNGISYAGSVTEGFLRMTCTSRKGKLQNGGADGIIYYYTKIPVDKNFKISASVRVDSWEYSNGQESFGLMATDRVGLKGDKTPFWNNSYAAHCGSVKVLENNITGELDEYKEGDDTPTGMTKVSAALGIGARERSGITQANYDDFVNGNTEVMQANLSTKWAPITKEITSDNIVANGTNIDGNLTDFNFSIERNNTGYFVSYTDQAGDTTTYKFYDRDALNKLDTDYIYAGFFITRSVDVVFSDISFTTSEPLTDAPAEERPIKYIKPSYNIESAAVSNTENYSLKFSSSVSGDLKITKEDGSVLVEESVVAGATNVYSDILKLGNNQYTVEITPSANQDLGDYRELESYEKATLIHNVEYNRIYGDLVYVSPLGSPSGLGTKESPVDLDTAISFTAPGQKIVLESGTYSRSEPLYVCPGVDGTSDKKIYLIAEDINNRPVINFSGTSKGLYIRGDYWYIQNIDITNTGSEEPGITVSGNNCVFDGVNSYSNGGPGFKLFEYDERPSGNTFLNCTAYNNGITSKSGLQVHGFAVSKSTGPNNVFDGCISYNNADSGFATGSQLAVGAIGGVLFKNCVAFGNGYLFDGSKKQNGCGFKMASSGVSEKHKALNCIAFDNASVGFMSGSCPDIIVTNCIAYNNHGSNINLYRSQGDTTDDQVYGLLSYRGNDIVAVNDSIKLKSNQLEDPELAAKVYNDTNYFWTLNEYDTWGQYGYTCKNAFYTVNDTWFTSVNTGMDYTAHTYATVPVTRNADNTINMNGLLELTEIGIAAMTEAYACKLQCTPSPEIDLSQCYGTIGRVTGDTTGVITLRDNDLKVSDSKHDNEYGEKDNVVSGFGKGKLAEVFKKDTLIDYTGMIIRDKEGNEIAADAAIGTGCKVSYQFYNDGKVIKTDEYISMVKGDTNGDGDINVRDLKDMLKDMLSIQALEGINKQAALINDESTDKVSVLDMEALMKDMLEIKSIE